MNVDEAMRCVGDGQNSSRDGYAVLFNLEIGTTLSAEVERLRAELAQLRKDWCDDDEAIKQQALRVLDAAKVEGDSVYVPRMGALAEMMADELVKVCAELAAAKGASVCPVKWKSAEQFFQSGADLGNQWGIELWFENKEQRDKFGKWMKERGEG